MGQYQPQRFGHSPRDVEIAESDRRASIAALLHPSFGVTKQGRRMQNMRVPTTSQMSRIDLVD
jgi:hypothetical protein